MERVAERRKKIQVKSVASTRRCRIHRTVSLRVRMRPRRCTRTHSQLVTLTDIQAACPRPAPNPHSVRVLYPTPIRITPYGLQLYPTSWLQAAYSCSIIIIIDYYMGPHLVRAQRLHKDTFISPHRHTHTHTTNACITGDGLVKQQISRQRRRDGFSVLT